MWDIPDTDDDDHLERLRLHLGAVERVAGLGTWEAVPQTGALTCSANVHRILGRPETTELRYADLLDAVHRDDRERVRAVHAGASDALEPRSVEHRIVQPDGTTRELREDVTAERDARGGVRLLGTLQDITDHVALTRNLIDTESRRRELLHQLVRASERARDELAGELHDGPIQTLTVAAMRLEHLGMVETDAPAWLPEAVGTVRDTIVQLRDVLVELHPRAGAGGGLGATLTQLASTVVPDLDVRVEVRGDADDAENRTVFGIVQEALWDVRDGGPSQYLDIEVDVAEDSLEVVFTGGRRSDGSATGLLSRAGLLGVRERTEGVGGRCTVEAGDGDPSVRCLLPRTASDVSGGRG